MKKPANFFDFDYFLGAINRAYYCILAVLVLLYENGHYAKTHQGLQVKYSELFIKTHLMERKHGDAMRYVFELRQTSDYDLDAELSKEDAMYAIEAATQFLEASKILLDA
ncbi:MAG: HEPN domain-containing protein [Lewinellaceae bacterium]|nr:HEPN domain-containing protein [Lewinellaceae bacterium]